MGKSDLSHSLKSRNGDKGALEGEDGEGANGRNQNEIDEELLMDMCKFSSMSSSNNLKK
jgi:hypothetical protein